MRVFLIALFLFAKICTAQDEWPDYYDFNFTLNGKTQVMEDSHVELVGVSGEEYGMWYLMRSGIESDATWLEMLSEKDYKIVIEIKGKYYYIQLEGKDLKGCGEWNISLTKKRFSKKYLMSVRLCSIEHGREGVVLKGIEAEEIVDL